MSVNLLEKIQQNLHYPPLQKIDPNTEKVVEDKSKPDEHRFSQAAIPAILTALYNYSKNDEGAKAILSGDNSTNWLASVFGDDNEFFTSKIGEYAYQEQPSVKLNAIASEAVRVIKEHLGAEATMMDVKELLASQMNTFLLYLPEELHLGASMNDTTLDDNTHKMEGPISTLMHKIGSAFAKPTSEEEIKQNQRVTN